MSSLELPRCSKYDSVMTISQRTEALISERAATYTHGKLTSLLKYAMLGQNDPGKDKAGGSWNNIPTRISKALGKNPSTESLIALGTRILNETATADPEPDWVRDLRGSLFADGYSLSHDDGKWIICPVGAEEVPLLPQISHLEAALLNLGFQIAANHYQQAFTSFKGKSWEACNASTRSTFEAFLVEMAIQKAAFIVREGQSNGGPAIQALQNANNFEPGEHDYVKGLWKMSHTNGSHPGLSSEEESMFRFSAVTSTITFFIKRWIS